MADIPLFFFFFFANYCVSKTLSASFFRCPETVRSSSNDSVGVVSNLRAVGARILFCFRQEQIDIPSGDLIMGWRVPSLG